MCYFHISHYYHIKAPTILPVTELLLALGPTNQKMLK